MFYKFSKTAIEKPDGLSGYTVYNHFANGGKYSQLSEKEKRLFSELWHYDAYNHGIIKQMGWCFDFRSFFKKYLVKLKHYGWREQYAPNKTFIRQNAVTPSHVLRIIEID